MSVSPQNVQLFSTSPQSGAVSGEDYIKEVIRVAQWSEEYGCEGILVYTDNSLVDPWLVSQIIIENTHGLSPLVAVQPIYMHPYSVAKMVSTLAHLYGRRVYLNMVAGGFKNDLVALNDTTPHDKRYERLVEYTTIIKQLLRCTSPVTFQGDFYTVHNLKLRPELSAGLDPGIFVSGSSEAGIVAARAIGATAVQYPQPAEQCGQPPDWNSCDFGIRVGLIARADADEAWSVAQQRFPHDRKGELTHQLAMKTSDSSWHRQLSETAKRTNGEKSVYWMLPFETYKTFCPYLVGSYDQVAEEVGSYLVLGFRKIILDIPPSEDELRHVNIVVQKAAQRVEIRPLSSSNTTTSPNTESG
jgi:alkanesulfonate monooxygenase